MDGHLASRGLRELCGLGKLRRGPGSEVSCGPCPLTPATGEMCAGRQLEACEVFLFPRPQACVHPRPPSGPLPPTGQTRLKWLKRKTPGRGAALFIEGPFTAEWPLGQEEAPALIREAQDRGHSGPGEGVLVWGSSGPSKHGSQPLLNSVCLLQACVSSSGPVRGDSAPGPPRGGSRWPGTVARAGGGAVLGVTHSSPPASSP